MDKQIAKEDGYPKTNENNNSETETTSNIEETMKGYYMCSLEGEEARIEYEKLTHSYTSENYGEEIAKYLIKKNGNIAEPNLENIMDKVIWKNDKLVLVYDEYEGYFSLYKLPGLETESLKHRNVIKLTESDLKRVISESVKKVLKETYLGFDTDEHEKDAIMKSHNYGYATGKSAYPYPDGDMNKMWRDRKYTNPFPYEDGDEVLDRLTRMEHAISTGKLWSKIKQSLSPQEIDKIRRKDPEMVRYLEAMYDMDRRNNA